MRKRRDRAYTEKLLESFTKKKNFDESTESVEEEKRKKKSDVGEATKPLLKRSKIWESEEECEEFPFDFREDSIEVDYNHEDVSKREDSLRFVASTLGSLSLSDSNIKKIVDCAGLIINFNITAEEIKGFKSNELRIFADPRTKRYCSFCLEEIKTSFDVCERDGCELKSVKPVRGSSSQQTVITSYSIRNQLNKVIEHQKESLIETHFHHHYTSASIDLSSFHLSPKYKRNIESREDFEMGKLRLPASIAFDGFVPTNTSKYEVTPLYLRLEGVPNREKEKESSVIVASVLTGPAGLNSSNAKLFINRFVNELEEIKLNPIKVNYGEKIWECSLEIVMKFCDAKGSRQVSGFPNWSSLTGCTECKIVGTRNGKSAVSYYTQVTVMERSRQEVNDLMKENKKTNPLCTLVNPKDQPLDELHVVCEGIFKRTLNDLLGRSDYFKELRLSNRLITQLDDCLSKVSKNGNVRSRFVSLTKLGKLTGQQIKHTSRVIFTLLSLTGIYGDLHVAVFLLVLVRFVDLLMTITSTEDVDLLQEMKSYLKEWIGTNHSSSYSFKTHMLLDHSIQKIQEYGNMSATSTAPFEKCHRFLSIEYNQFSTNPEHMCNTFLLKKCFGEMISGEPDDTVFLAEGVYSNPNFELKEEKRVREMTRICGHLIESPVFWKRLRVGGKLLSSSSWQRKSGGDRKVIFSFDQQGTIVFAEPLSFLSSPNGIFVLVTELNCRNPIRLIYDAAHVDNFKTSTLDMLWNMSCGNNWVMEVLERGTTTIVPLEHIRKEFICLDFRGRMFILESHH